MVGRLGAGGRPPQDLVIDAGKQSKIEISTTALQYFYDEIGEEPKMGKWYSVWSSIR